MPTARRVVLSIFNECDRRLSVRLQPPILAQAISLAHRDRRQSMLVHAAGTQLAGLLILIPRHPSQAPVDDSLVRTRCFMRLSGGEVGQQTERGRRHRVFGRGFLRIFDVLRATGILAVFGKSQGTAAPTAVCILMSRQPIDRGPHGPFRVRSTATTGQHLLATARGGATTEAIALGGPLAFRQTRRTHQCRSVTDAGETDSHTAQRRVPGRRATGRLHEIGGGVVVLRFLFDRCGWFGERLGVENGRLNGRLTDLEALDGGLFVGFVHLGIDIDDLFQQPSGMRRADRHPENHQDSNVNAETHAPKLGICFGPVCDVLRKFCRSRND